MTIIHEKFSITSKGKNDIIDITLKVKEFIRNLDITDAILNVYVNSSNISIITTDDNFIIKTNYIDLINSTISSKNEYDKLQYNPILEANLKTEILGRNINIPIINKEIQISEYQKIVLIDFGENISVSDVIISVIN